MEWFLCQRVVCESILASVLVLSGVFFDTTFDIDFFLAYKFYRRSLEKIIVNQKVKFLSCAMKSCKADGDGPSGDGVNFSASRVMD